MKIMLFLHGTALMHKNGLGRMREQRVKQVLDGNESVYDLASYIPVDNVVRKLHAWRQQGAEIVFGALIREAKMWRRIGQVFYRRSGKHYHDVVESVLPNLLIEDDCESIGGEREMTYPRLRPEFKAKIKSIAVKEFGGIDHLPDDIPG